MNCFHRYSRSASLKSQSKNEFVQLYASPQALQAVLFDPNESHGIVRKIDIVNEPDLLIRLKLAVDKIFKFINWTKIKSTSLNTFTQFNFKHSPSVHSQFTRFQCYSFQSFSQPKHSSHKIELQSLNSLKFLHPRQPFTRSSSSMSTNRTEMKILMNHAGSEYYH